MRAIRERVEARRATQSGARAEELERALSEARRLARVNAHWGVTSSWPVAGRIEILAKRAMRIAARWYINPIVEQQNEFNLAVLGALYEIEAELAALRGEGHGSKPCDEPAGES
jgi:hypothetical protein